jgi:hypothetical protein
MGRPDRLPLNLHCDKRKISPVSMYQRIVFGFFLPVGEYQRSSAVNLSSRAWSANPYYNITGLLGKHWETSWRIHHLWNAVNHATPLATGLRSMQAGQATHFNATLGYALPRGLWIGANTYYLKQVTNPSVNGVPLPDSPEQIAAIVTRWSVGFGPLSFVRERLSRVRRGEPAGRRKSGFTPSMGAREKGFPRPTG